MAGFLNRLAYQTLDATTLDGYGALAEKVGTPERGLAIFLSTAPSLFGPTIKGLQSAGLTGENARMCLEKPLGTDLPRAARSTTLSRAPSRKAGFSASITISARRQSRTCWRCALPI